MVAFCIRWDRAADSKQSCGQMYYEKMSTHIFAESPWNISHNPSESNEEEKWGNSPLPPAICRFLMDKGVENLLMVLKICIWLYRAWGRCLEATLKTCDLKHFFSCKWVAEWRVSHAQTRERGPPSAWAEFRNPTTSSSGANGRRRTNYPKFLITPPGVPHYRVCSHDTLHSAPHWHEKFFWRVSAESPSNLSSDPSVVIS